MERLKPPRGQTDERATAARQATIVVIHGGVQANRQLDGLLRSEGFHVFMVPDGKTGLLVALSERADLVLLEAVLPDVDGLEICRLLRRVSDAYVCLIGAGIAAAERAAGLNAGAHEYLEMPLSVAELAVHVRELLHRFRELPRTDRVWQVGDLEVDLDAREVRHAGQEIHLTSIELGLLEALLTLPRRVWSRQELLARVWGPSWVSNHHLIDVHMSKLRHKLGEGGQRPRHVLTVRGTGYRLGNSSCDGRGGEAVPGDA